MSNEAFDEIVDIMRKQNFSEALKLINKQMLTGQPNVKLLNLRANINLKLKNFQDAKMDFKEALKLVPDAWQLYFNLGNVYVELTQNTKAIQSFQKSLEIKPNTFEVLFNLANVLQRSGRHVEAILKYRDCINLQPSNANLISNTLISLAATNNRAEFVGMASELLSLSECSLDNCRTLLSLAYELSDDMIFQKTLTYVTNRWTLDSNFKILIAAKKAQAGHIDEAIEYLKDNQWEIHEGPRVFHAIANLYMSNSDQPKALIYLEKALSIEPQNILFLRTYAGIIENIVLRDASEDTVKILCNIIDLQVIRPEIIAPTASSVCSAFLDDLITNDELLNNWTAFKQVIKSILEFGLITRVLKSGQFVTKSMEELLRKLLSLLVIHQRDVYQDIEALDLWQSIIIYNQRSGFLLNARAESYKPDLSVKTVGQDIVKSENNDELILLTLETASYRALTDSERDILLGIDNVPLELLNNFIKESERVQHIRKEIEDDASKIPESSNEVAKQYINYPYPSWTTLRACDSTTLVQYIETYKINYNRANFHANEFRKVLIAGCGTGRHAIEFASKVKGVDVDAIDISSQSLAYATFMQRKYEIMNINFQLCELQRITALNNTYDVIECVGVLNHVKDPKEALSALVNTLKPGGLLLLGLYSTSARRDISNFRSRFSDSKRSTISAIELTSERNKLLDDINFEKTWMNYSPDFYSLSGFKDLFFNVREHTFSLFDVEILLNEQQLTFSGMANSSKLLNLSDSNSSNVITKDLQYWQKIEERTPNIFSQMYQFWCQKN